MNEQDHLFFLKSYTLEHTKRYSMTPVVHEESVATHSYFVALGVLLLSHDYHFDVNVALKIAICHDLAEMEISDVNHKVKKNFPHIAMALQLAESEVINDFPAQVKEYCKLYNSDMPEAIIVHYCDALQCYQYASHEVSLGNTGYMLEVKLDSMARLQKLNDKLERFKRDNN
jgi:5'-deoxynucleotidase YfbR-like HD superfamily hydrolase